jgi:uncharacterized protein YndB with AHSA1/START domain
MDPVTVSVTIDRPREEIFGYLLDIANHAEFTDHFLVDWRLTREQSVGRGAGARFRIKRRRDKRRFNYADVTLIEVDPPRRLVAGGRGGKGNRIRLRSVYELEPASGGTTRVSWSVETRSATLSDRLREGRLRRYLKRKNGKALRRLRRILEEGEGRGARVSVAAG